MTYPSASYLEPAALNVVLELAQALHRAAGKLHTLTRGPEGRDVDASRAVEQWIGPSRDLFGQLMANERRSAWQAQTMLAEEAEALARFWAMASNARVDRLHDEALAQYRADLDRYEDRVVADRLVEGPLEHNVPLPSPPAPPRRPAAVSTPGVRSDYRPIT